MIKESIQQTIQLIETVKKVDPTAYLEQRKELEALVQQMKIVTISLSKDKTVECIFNPRVK